MKIRKIIRNIVILSSLLLSFMLSQTYAARGIAVKIKTTSGTEEAIQLYGGSYALLVGVSDYRSGWPSLESVPGELDKVEDLLKSKGFTVEKHIDPDNRELKLAFENFINRYGYTNDNRLLFFFSGHGHSRKNGRKGYLVPVDAPDPEVCVSGEPV
jgi:hypothetical protein